MQVPEIVSTAAYIVTAKGKRAAHLAHKQEFHRRRAAIERQILTEAKTDSSLFRENCCPACGGAPGTPTFSNAIGFSFVECPTDGTVYMNPVPAESTLERMYNSDAYTFNWTAGRTADDVTVVKIKRSIELDHIRRVTSFPSSPRPRLLDVGCATGAFLERARETFDVEGVELNAETAAIARRNGFPVTTGRLEDMSSEPRFDVITMLQLIEHVTEPAALLSRAASLLRPGGFIYINTPAVDSASFRLFRERHNHVSWFGHVSLFTRASWPLLSARVGLTLAAHEYCGDRDIALHDLLTWYFARPRFRHRWALYSPRFFYACRLVDRLSQGVLTSALSPRGNLSYQFAVLQKPLTA
jgi:SAM-dependent methyltransferase